MNDSERLSLNEETRQALSATLLALADDQLILGHRDSEWCAHAPILEEDIAFANIALDEIGHAHLWYGLLADLVDEDPDSYPDKLVFWREPGDFRNVQMVELPKGDWSFSILRQYLSDTAELVQLDGLSSSSYGPLAEAAAKISREEQYHRRHTQAWMRRLGLGTEESHRRLQEALNELWLYAGQWLAPDPGEDVLVQQGLLPDPKQIQQDWIAEVQQVLEECELEIPPLEGKGPARGQHTRHMRVLVEEMQSVARLDPLASW